MSDIEKIINEAWEDRKIRYISRILIKKLLIAINETLLNNLDQGKKRVAANRSNDVKMDNKSVQLKKAILLSHLEFIKWTTVTGPYSSWYDMS